MAVNLAEKYSGKLEQRFQSGSYTDRWVNHDYEFTGVKTIHVLTATSQELVDYDRTATGDRYGGNNELQDTEKSYTLTNDKAFKIAIDDGNLKQQMRAKQAAKVLKLQLDEQVTPAIDMERIAVAADGASFADQAYTATAGDAYGDTLKLNAALDEQKAPVVGRVLWITPGFYNLVKKEIVKGAQASGYNDKLLGKGFVGELDGVPVVKVPTSYFPTGVNAIMVHKSVLLAAKQINKAQVIEDSELVDGAVLVGRFIYGAFILEAKKKGVASIVGEDYVAPTESAGSES